MDKTPDDVQEKIRDILGSSIFYSKQDCKWVLIEAYPGSLTKAISALLSQELAKRDELISALVKTGRIVSSSVKTDTEQNWTVNSKTLKWFIREWLKVTARLKEINNEYTVGIYRSGNTDSHCTVGSVGVR